MSKPFSAPFSMYEGNLIAGGNPKIGDTGGCRFFGLAMGQNQHALVAFDTLFKALEAEGRLLARIIELGTGRGGLSIFLHLYCLSGHIVFTTWDQVNHAPAHQSVLEALNVDYRQGDIHNDESTIQQIQNDCQSTGITILLCDDGCKAREVEIFAPSLKPGDLLLAHDYAPNPVFFETAMRGRIWSSHELSLSDISQTIDSRCFEPYLQEVFQMAAWACLRRRDDRTNISYGDEAWFERCQECNRE